MRHSITISSLLFLLLAGLAGADEPSDEAKRRSLRDAYRNAADAATRRAIVEEMRRMRIEEAWHAGGDAGDEPGSVAPAPASRILILEFPEPWASHLPRDLSGAQPTYDVAQPLLAGSLARDVAGALEAVEPILLGDDRSSAYAGVYRDAILEWRDLELEYEDGRDLTAAEMDALEARLNALRANVLFRAQEYAERRMRLELRLAREEAERALAAQRRMKQLAFLAGDSQGVAALLPALSSTATLADHLGQALDEVEGYPWWSTRLPHWVSNVATFGLAIHDWASDSPLRQGSALEGMTEVANLATTLSTVNSLQVTPLALFTSHVGPILTVISDRLDDLQLRLIEENDLWENLGFERPYPNADPGGPAMNEYLSSVMVAGDALDGPALEGEVLEYFETQREAFDAVTPGDPIPTTGLVMTGIDRTEFRAWIHRNRDHVWDLLYGPRRRPSRG